VIIIGEERHPAGRGLIYALSEEQEEEEEEETE